MNELPEENAEEAYVEKTQDEDLEESKFKNNNIEKSFPGK